MRLTARAIRTAILIITPGTAEMCIRDRVSFGPMNLKLPAAEVKRRVDEALACMNLVEMKDRPPHYLLSLIHI